MDTTPHSPRSRRLATLIALSGGVLALPPVSGCGSRPGYDAAVSQSSPEELERARVALAMARGGKKTPGPSQPGSNTEPTAAAFAIDVALEVSQSGSSLLADLAFTNHGPDPYALEQTNVAATSTQYIQIYDGSQLLRYTGPHRKVGGDEVVVIGPGETVKSRISLQDRYEFPEGEQVYWAQYQRLHFPDPEHGDGMVHLDSNIAQFPFAP